MAEIISRFSKTTNIQQTAGSTNTISNDDSRTPFGFSDWYSRNVGVIPGKEKAQYEQYLLRWYSEREQNKTDATDQIQEDYTQLLEQISLVFHDEAEQDLAVDIDFTDRFELEQALPFYTRKLKEIAIYLVNKREAIKRAKLKYNQTGVRNALEKLFYEYLLKAFTRRQFPGNEYITQVSDVNYVSALPFLSAVDNFQILVEELYDNSEYFDKDPTIGASTYYDLCASNVVPYLTAKGFSPDEFEWVYETGFAQLCADNPLLYALDDIIASYGSNIPVSAYESYDSSVLNAQNQYALTEKYLGSAQYIVSGGYYVASKQTIQIPFEPGNNWFYWTSGEHFGENDTSISVDSLPLTASNLIQSGAYAASDFTESDVIFTQRENDIKGAWLQLSKSIPVNPTMVAKLNYGRTAFAFPFPGFGLSGEDLDWTGRELSNLDLTYNYLDTNTQLAIQKMYWNTKSDGTSSLVPMFLSDTSLIESGALASTVYASADQIMVRSDAHDNNPNGTYTGDINHAWLYRMEKTDIPIAEGTNLIYWPFVRYTDTISIVAPSSQCITTVLSAIDLSNSMLGAIAGHSIEYADKLYKMDSPKNGNVINAAWLSGAPLKLSYLTNVGLLTAASQPGVGFAVQGGSFATFIWESNNLNANNVFPGYEHQVDCDYRELPAIHSLYQNRPEQEKDIDYNQWEKCTCRAIEHSPFGHPGSNYDEYNRLADYIVSVHNPLSSASLEDWRDGSGRTYKTSDEFGWFKLTGTQLEPDAGWGLGSWVTYTGQPFSLSANRMYQYNRSSMLREDSTTTTPYFVGKYPFNNNKQKWIKMTFSQKTGEWESTGQISDIKLDPGEYFKYEHQSSQVIGLTADDIQIVEIESFSPPNLQQFTIVSVLTSTPSSTTSQTITSTNYNLTQVSPTSAYMAGTNSYNNISYPDMTSGQTITSTAGFNVPPAMTLTTFTSAVSTFGTYEVYFNTPSINFMVNVGLSGWNYNNNVYDGVSSGARPYWAKAYDDRSNQTKCKGINIWGGSTILVDDYNFKSQPDISDIQLDLDDYFEYNRVGDDPLIWTQDLTLNVDVIDKAWKKLIIDSTKVSNLSSILHNNVLELVVSGSTIDADITFDIIEGWPLFVNYYAASAFTWTQEISDSSLGLPPTGGIWIPAVSAQLVDPLAPYAYLTNRHYPTYATAPYVGDLYTIRESGGFFVPKMLAASVFLGKDRQHEIDPVNIDPRVDTYRGLHNVYRNINDYLTDSGLTRTDQVELISAIHLDARWMKGSITEFSRAGVVSNVASHQKLLPYQTKFETTKKSNIGLRHQNDEYDPWTGELDDAWSNNMDWPPDFRKLYNIEKWYQQFDQIQGLQLYQWKTDIFGNQYMLLKDIKGKSIYEKGQELGVLYTRDARDLIKSSTEFLSEVYDKFTVPTSAISGSMLGIDVWFDVMMIHTPEQILFAKLDFDYDNNIISTITDDVHQIPLCDSKFGGTWFFEEDKRVTICTMASAGTDLNPYYYPILMNLDLDSNEMKTIFELGDDYSELQTMSSLQLSSIEDPVITFSEELQKYNIGFIGYSRTMNGMYFGTIDIKRTGNEYIFDSFHMITPIA